MLAVKKSVIKLILMRILSNEECHNRLSATYDELRNDRAKTTIITRAALRGEPTYLYPPQPQSITTASFPQL